MQFRTRKIKVRPSKLSNWGWTSAILHTKFSSVGTELVLIVNNNPQWATYGSTPRVGLCHHVQHCEQVAVAWGRSREGLSPTRVRNSKFTSKYLPNMRRKVGSFTMELSITFASTRGTREIDVAQNWIAEGYRITWLPPFWRYSTKSISALRLRDIAGQRIGQRILKIKLELGYLDSSTYTVHQWQCTVQLYKLYSCTGQKSVLDAVTPLLQFVLLKCYRIGT